MNLASYLEHTMLRSNTTKEDISRLCSDAIQHGFKAVCIPPYYVGDVFRKLEEHDVKVVTVVGFPMGYAATPAKVEEAKRAIDEGADEIDMVINICAVKDKKWSYVKNDIESVTRAIHLKGKVVKIILETGILTNDELKKVCTICMESGVDYVKTSTGFAGEGATIDVIKFLKKQVGDNVKIKASGGIKTAEMANTLIEAGASRIGTSSSLQIIGK